MSSWGKWATVVILAMVVFVGGQLPDGRLHIYFCDVGQGDAELIVKGSVQMVIDGGPEGEKVLKCLSQYVPFWDRRIELVVNTHPQKDHVGGLDDILERYAVDKLMINRVAVESDDYLRLMKKAEEKKVEVVNPKKGDRIEVAGIKMRVVWPEERWEMGEEFEGDLNELSVVLWLEYGQFEALFTGDIGEAEELAIIDEGVLTAVEVLKVAHHGSKFSSSARFVGKLRPKVAVFEVGAKNSYGHPDREIVKRFDAVGAKTLRTDEEGTIEVVSDGERMWVK